MAVLNSAGLLIDRQPIRAYVGAAKPKVVLVGEAFGEQEDLMRQPFCGYAGKELFQMLGEAAGALDDPLWTRPRSLFRYDNAWTAHRGPWLEAQGIGLTNVFNLRPPNNKLEHFCASRAELGGVVGGLSPLGRGTYLRSEYFPELDRLGAELSELQPNLVVPLGATALWALTGQNNIGSVRGTVRLGDGRLYSGKILPTWHPAGVLRQWSNRPIAVADLAKALREALFPEIRRPRRNILVSPTMEELRSWARRVLAQPPERISSDIETAQGQITEIGFAIGPSEACVIPFVDQSKPGWNYWPSPAEEREAWDIVEDLLNCGSTVTWQNGMYDAQYILQMGLRCPLDADTMLRHHSIFPEMQKGLGFLGSIYTTEPAWKLMRRKRADTEKRDE